MNKNSKNILGNINIHGNSTTNIEINSNNFSSDPQDHPQEPITIQNYINIDDQPDTKILEDNHSAKSDDTDTALDYTDLLATYENAKEEIKKNSGDKKKLQALNFKTDNNSNKILVTYDHMSKKKLMDDFKPTLLDQNICENEISVISKSTGLNNTLNNFENSSITNTNNVGHLNQKHKDSISFQFDEYSFEGAGSESFMKSDFLKFSNGVAKNKNY